MTSTALNALAARVEQGSGRDADLDGRIFDAFSEPGLGSAHQAVIDRAKAPDWLPSYTTDLTAVVSLIERVLPGCGFELSVASNQVRPVSHAYLTQSEEMWTYKGWDNATAQTPARALLAALLRAAAAQIGER